MSALCKNIVIVVFIVLMNQMALGQSPQLSPSDFSASFDITIDHTKVSGVTDLTDFPVLIDITNASLRNTANGGSMQNMNGYDILFSGDCDEVFHHDLELYTETTGRVVAWVRIPTVYATAATTFKLNYGNASMTDNPSTSATWNADYEGVWHLHNDFLDATGNDNDATNNGSVDGTAQIADGQDFNGSSHYVQTTSNGLKTANDFSISVWFNADATNFTRNLIWQGDGSGNSWGNPHEEMHLSMGNFTTVSNNDVLTFFLGNIHVGVDPNVLMVSTAFTDVTNWHHAYVNVKNMSTTPTAELYLDGVLQGTDTGLPASTGRTGWDTDMRFGRPGASTRYYDGYLDEVKTATVARSSDWILTEYNNQNSPSTFYTVVAGSVPDNDDTISGNLFEDLDADGVKDVGEVGHPNATVQLLDDVNEDGIVDGGDIIIQTTTSDANGDYSFDVPRKMEISAVTNDNDDAEEDVPSGNTILTSSDLDFGYRNGSTVVVTGMRFPSIDIPSGAVITDAYIEFTAYSTYSSAVNLSIWGEDADNAAVYTGGTANFNITTRTYTSEQANWAPPTWTADQIYYSPQLKDIAQEILDRAGWTSGNAMNFIIEGDALKRNAHSITSDPNKVPRLFIEYYVPPLSEYYLVNLDETTLPPIFDYSTVSEYSINFTSCSGETNSGNDFGIQIIDVCGNGLDDNNDGNIDEPYPGGIGNNLLLWLKADAGFSAVTWTDQSPAQNDATVYGDPTQVSNSLNFNNGITFDGNDHVESNLPELAFENGTKSVAIFAVYKPSTSSNTIGVFGNEGISSINIHLQGGNYGRGNGENGIAQAFGTSPHLISYVIDEENNIGGGANDSEIHHNGSLHQAFTFNEITEANVDQDFHIGKSGSNAASTFFQGDIQEIIIYFEDNGNTAITESEREQIESYLAIKYGISLSHDYTDSQ